MEVAFTEINSPTSNILECIKFIDTIGLACGGDLFFESDLIRSLDGGNTWQKIELPENVNQRKRLFALDMFTDGTVHAVGFGGVTYKSNNFCDSVTYQQEPRFVNWTSIAFRNGHQAMACGQEEIGTGFIVPIKRTEGWTYPFAPENYTFGMNHITFPDSLNGYIAGFGAIYKTTDGGNNWEFTPAENDNFTATEWFSASEGVAIGWEGSILTTQNGGDEWTTIRRGNRMTQQKISLKSLAKNNRNELIAAGENGYLLYSNDRGFSWEQIKNFTDVNFESVAFQDDNTFFVVGSAGRIFKVQL